MEITNIYNAILRRAIDKTFMFWQSLGVHVRPNHFYEPVPDTRTLKDDIWSKYSELIGIDMNEKKQVELLSVFESKFAREYGSFPENKTSTPYEYYLTNPNFGKIDGEILYSIIRHFKPRKIFEIGSGYSTYLSAQAIIKTKQEDDHHDCELVAIEPYPNQTLKNGFPGLSKIVTKKVQDVPLSDFQKLVNNDILFIDSSHVLKIGSDVQYELLEIVPRLNKGVIVHIHDIFLPAEYRQEWVLKKHWFWTEQYLLQAFLSFNDTFEVLWAGSYMHLKHPDKLSRAFGSYKSKSWPSSFWMRKVK